MKKFLEKVMDFVSQYPCSNAGCSLGGHEKCEWRKKQSELLIEHYGNDELKDTLPKKKVEWGEFY